MPVYLQRSGTVRGGGGGGKGGEGGGPYHKQPQSIDRWTLIAPPRGLEGIKRWEIEGIRIGTSDRLSRGRGEFMK